MGCTPVREITPWDCTPPVGTAVRDITSVGLHFVGLHVRGGHQSREEPVGRLEVRGVAVRGAARCEAHHSVGLHVRGGH